jgi:hypothetical protein
MTDQQRQEHLTQSSPSNVARAQDLTSVSDAGWRQEKWDHRHEQEWEARLGNLEQCICELLIKNQKLRWLLESGPNQRQEFAGE